MQEEHMLAVKWQSLLSRLDGVLLSWSQAEKIVGKKRLQALCDNGLIWYNKPAGAPNTAWQFRAVEIYDHVKPNKKFF